MDSETSAAIFFFAVVLVLGALLFFGLRKQRRIMSSGLDVGHFELRPEQGKIRLSCSFDISTVRQWCRVVADFSMKESVWESSSLLARFPKFSEFHPYTIRVSDRNGKILFEEQRTFYDFLQLVGSKGGGWSLPFKGETSSGTRSGEVALLEFLPTAAGIYSLDFELLADEHIETDYFRRTASFERFALHIREGIEPLQKYAYKHQRVEFGS